MKVKKVMKRATYIWRLLTFFYVPVAPLVIVLFLCMRIHSVCAMQLTDNTLKRSATTIYEYFGLHPSIGQPALKDVRTILVKRLMAEKQWWYPKQLERGYNSAVHALAYSSDGAVLLAASLCAVRMWDQRGKKIAFRPYPCIIADIVTHPSEPFFIAALADQTLDKADFKGESIKTVKCASKPTALAMNATHVSTISADGLVRVRPLEGGMPLQSGFPISGQSHVAFHPMRHLLVTTNPKWIYIWEYDNKAIGPLMSNDDPVQFSSAGEVTAAAFQAQGQLLATACQNGSVSLWNSAWEKVKELPCTEKVTLLGFDRTGRFVAAACQQDHTNLNAVKGACMRFGVPNRITLWDIQSGAEIATLLEESTVKSFVFHPQKNRLAVACETGAVKVWKRHEPTLELFLIRLILKNYLIRCIVEGKKPESPTDGSPDDGFARWMAHMFNLDLVPLQEIVRHIPDGPRKSMIKTYMHRVRVISCLQEKIAAQQAEKAKKEEEQRQREWRERMAKSKQRGLW